MKKSKVAIVFFIYLVISLLIGIRFYFKIYSPDSYVQIGAGVDTFLKTAIGNVRPIQYLITSLEFKVLGFDVDYFTVYRLNITMSLILISLTMTIMYFFIQKLSDISTKTSKILLFFSLILVFYNAFLVDIFAFLENSGMVLSFCMAVVASIIYTSKKSIKARTLLTFFVLLISEFSYQTMVVAFSLFSMVFITIKNNGKISLKEIIKINVLATIPMFLLFGYSKILEMQGVRVLGRFESSKMLLTNLNIVLMLVLLYSIVYGIYIVLCIIPTKKEKDKEKVQINGLLISLFIALVFNMSFALINCGMISLRMAWPLETIPGLCIIYFLCLDKENTKKYKVLLVLFAIVELIKFVCAIQVYDFYHERVLTNVSELHKYIQEHEQTQIKKIAVYEDANITKDKWFSIVIYLNLILNNRNDDFVYQYKTLVDNSIEEAEPKEELIDYFKQFDWNEYNEKQFIIEGDTLHFCKY